MYSLISLFILFLYCVLPQIGFYAYIFDRGEYKYSESTTEIISDIDELTPRTRGLAIEFLKRCEESGLSVMNNRNL